MGTTIDFIEYVCDNTVFVKILPCLDETMREADKGFPYVYLHPAF